MRGGFALVVAVVVGGGLLMHALGFMAGFNTTPMAALGELQAAEAMSGGGEVDPAGRVVVVVVDGLRADEVDTLGLVSPDGVPHRRCRLRGVLPSFSRPSYVALSTGVPPWASGVHTNDHVGAAGLVSVWDMARGAGWRTRLVADGTDWWVELFPHAWDQVDSVEDARFDAFWDAQRLDSPGVVGRAFEPGSVTLVHLNEPDDEAHANGVGEEYRTALRRAGTRVNALIAGLDPERDTLFVTADHGHIARGGHGGPEDEVLLVPWLAFGAGILPMAQGAPIDRVCGRLEDVPVAIAWRLGLSPPPASFGAVLDGLAMSEGIAAKRAVQVKRLLAALGLGVRSEVDPFELGRVRAPSLGWAVFVALAWLGLVFVTARLVVPGTFKRALASTLVLPALGALTYLVFEPGLSLSAVWEEGPWTVRIVAMFAGVGLIAAWFVSSRHDPWDALLLMSLGAILPSSIALALHGSLGAGPVLGDPHAAFAMVVGDVLAASGLGAAMLVCIGRSLRERRRHHESVWV